MSSPRVTPRSAAVSAAPLAVPDVVAQLGDAMRDLVWLSDSEGAPLHQNRASRHYTGRPVEELRRDGWPALCHTDDRDRFASAWIAAIDAGAPFQLEFRCRRRDGAFRWFVCHASMVAATESVPRCWMAILTDVHRHRVLERELQRSVRQRDELLATLAHEVRNPLQALRQAIRVVQCPSVSDDVKAQMHAIMERQMALLLRLAADSLDLSRVRWGAMSLVPSSITLETLVSEATAGVRSLIEGSGVTLSVSIDEPECELIADAARLTQALTNLLGNAAKFGKAGGRISLRVACEDGEAVFRVRDWGCGIARARLAEIFDLFKRVHTTDVTQEQGLGIGLAVAQHVARLHGGTLLAHSEGLGHGSLFTLRVPLAAPSGP